MTIRPKRVFHVLLVITNLVLVFRNTYNLFYNFKIGGSHLEANAAGSIYLIYLAILAIIIIHFIMICVFLFTRNSGILYIVTVVAVVLSLIFYQFLSFKKANTGYLPVVTLTAEHKKAS